MNIDKSKLKIRKIGVEEIPVLVEYRLAYLAELQDKQDEANKIQFKKDLELYFRKSLEEGRFFAFYAETEGKILSFGGMIIQFILILSL